MFKQGSNNQLLETKHIITHTGTIVDATFVDAPDQRNTREENKTIKAGEIPEEWKSAGNIHKLRQKETDARWARKNKETHYGYKDHAKVDADSKIIAGYSTSTASVHDSQEFIVLLGESDKVIYADSAYSGEPIPKQLPASIENQIHEKGYRNPPLNENQKVENKKKSKIRVPIEHVFGFMTGSMHGITLRSIGIHRANFNIGLTNLVYNLCCYEIILRKNRGLMG